MFKHSIFLRIYAGLVVLVMLVALFGYLLVQIINYQRAQEYRESLTDGISFVISEGVARQPGEQQKLAWISDASDLLELPIYYVASNTIERNVLKNKNQLFVMMLKIALLTSLLVCPKTINISSMSK